MHPVQPGRSSGRLNPAAFVMLPSASTLGRHAGMHRPQPLQRSASSTTVPRVTEPPGTCAMLTMPLPRSGAHAGAARAGSRPAPGPDRPLVGLEVLGAVGGHQLAHGRHHAVHADQPGQGHEGAEEDEAGAHRVAQLGRHVAGRHLEHRASGTSTAPAKSEELTTTTAPSARLGRMVDQ